MHKNPLNTRQQAFVRKLGIEGKTQTQAYKEAYQVDSTEVAGANAHRLLKNASVQMALENIHDTFKNDAIEAYNLRKALMRDPMSGAALQDKIAADIIRLAGLEPSTKIEQKTENTYKGISDLTKEDLKKML